MPFKRVNVKEEIDKRLKNDPELAKAYNQAKKEYDIVKQLVRVRNDIGFTQSEAAKQSGLTQQMISRIETVDNSPTLKNFIRYVDSLGLEIKLKKKSIKRNYSKV